MAGEGSPVVSAGCLLTAGRGVSLTWTCRRGDWWRRLAANPGQVPRTSYFDLKNLGDGDCLR